MPRPERPLYSEGPIHEFAAALRELRKAAGNPGYRELAKQAGVSVTTLSDAAGGRRLPSLPATLAYVRACDGDVEGWRRRWQAVAAELAGTADSVPPYLGLASFQITDTHRFFGRERMVRELLDRLVCGRFLAVFGASGSGKSSLLRAGLLPAATTAPAATGAALPAHPWAAGPWHPVLLTPGRTPDATLRAQLSEAPPGNRLIVVDQFEEVFTAGSHRAEQERFIRRLLAEATAAQRQTRVVLGVRADFCASCGRFPELVAAMAERTVLIGPMTDDELSRAVTRPATQCGLTVERALVAQVIADAGRQPGALPLVSHALLETWRQRQGSILTQAGYQAAGGVRGAIAGTAERIYGRLTARQQVVARQIMLRLITFGEGTEDTRRLVSRTEFDLNDADAVIDTLVGARLLVVRDDVVEIAHEALIGAWPRLREWLTADREGLRIHRRLTDAAATWSTLDREDGALYRGTQLAATREWAGTGGRHDELTPLEREFLAASVAEEVAEQAAASRRRRRSQQLTLALAVLLALALGAGGLAAWQWRSAVGQRQIAVSRQYATQAITAAPLDVPEAMRLSLAAYRAAPTADARGALLSLASRRQYTGRLEFGGLVKDVAFSPDGATFAAGVNDGQIVICEVAGRTHRQRLTGHGAAVRALAYSRDGRWLVSGSLDGSVIMWDLGRGVETRRLRAGGGLIDSVAVSPDGATIAALGTDRRTMLWRSSDGAAIGELAGSGGDIVTVAFSPDGRLLVSTADDGTATIWDVTSHSRLSTVDAGSVAAYSAAFSPDGRFLAVGGIARDIYVWELATGRRRALLRSHTAAVSDLAFTADGTRLVSAGYDFEVKIWDVAQFRRLVSLKGAGSALYTVAVSPDGATIAAGGRDNRVLLWDLDRLARTPHADEVRSVHVSRTGSVVSGGKDGTIAVWDPASAGRPLHVTGDTSAPTAATNPAGVADTGFSPDGTRVVSAYANSPARIWDAATGRLVHRLGDDTRGLAVAFHPDGARVAVAGTDHSVHIWNAQTATAVVSLPHPAEVSAVAFSTDGQTMVSASRDGTVIVWRTSDWSATTLSGTDAAPPGTSGLTSAGLSPDGGIVAIGHGDGSVRVWRTRDRRTVASLASHSGPVNVTAFSPDGHLIATAGLDRVVRLWSVRPYRIVATLTGSPDGVADVAWSPDGRLLYTAGGDHTVTAWTVRPVDAAARLCRDLARDFPAQPRPHCRH